MRREATENRQEATGKERDRARDSEKDMSVIVTRERDASIVLERAAKTGA